MTVPNSGKHSSHLVNYFFTHVCALTVDELSGSLINNNNQLNFISCHQPSRLFTYAQAWVFTRTHQTWRFSIMP